MDAADEQDRQRAIAAKGADMRQNVGVYLKRVQKYHEGEEHEEKLIEDTFKFIASTAEVDRMGDIVEQSWRLDAFRRNPVILWNHDSSRAPIARAVGVEVINEQLVIEMQFDMADPFAAEVAGKIQRGFINAGSVGFFPGQVKYRGDLDPEDPRYSSGYGIVASDNELVEFSITPVPANSSALLAASADAATDDDLRKLMANKANRSRLAALLAGGDPPTCTHDHSQDVKHADPLGWLRDTTPAQTDRLPFIKE